MSRPVSSPTKRRPGRADQGSTIPLILGFFLIALITIAGSVALGQAFVQQRALQDICDGAASAASAAAASSADLDRGASVASADSLRFGAVEQVVDAYLVRDPHRDGVTVRAQLSGDRQRLTLICAQTVPLAFGSFFGRGRVHHVATSSARAAVLG